VHNRLSSQHQPGAWQYNQDNQLLGYGVGSAQITLSYSTNGHTTREVTGNPAAPLKVRDYRYNAAERLTEIDDNGQAIGRYRYDPMGRRVYKETATETMWFIYADEGLIAELQADGTLKRGYGWKPQGLWGTDPLWLADKTGAGQNDWSTHVYHNDHLWTPQRLTDSAGVVSWSGRSEAFGLTTATVNIVDNPLRFPGQYWDPETGGYYNFMRSYNPLLGRYAESDPLGLSAGINWYSYVNSRVTVSIDPFGLFCITTTCKCRVNPPSCGLQPRPTPAPIRPSPEPAPPPPGPLPIRPVVPPPVPSPPSRDRDSPCCKTDHPTMETCSELGRKGFIYSSQGHAKLYYGSGVVVKNVREAERDRGSCSHPLQHMGVYVAGEPQGRGNIGSIISCSCCTDTGGGPVVEARYKATERDYR